MRIRAPLAATLGLLLAACATTPETDVRERLDERTGVTVTSMHAPLEFYSPRPERGLQAASFAYLAPLEINNMGKRDTYLWLSVLRGEEDRGDAAPVPSESPNLRLALDGGSVEPTFVTTEAREVGLGQPVYERPARWVGEAYYAVTPEQIAQMAAASVLALELHSGSDEPRRYELSKLALEGLRAFSERISTEAP